MRFGLIGTGFMGKAHAIALRSVATVFADVEAPELACLVDVNGARAEQEAQAWGFARHSTDWRSVCNAEDIDVIDICTPN
ncbi:MAG: Gfo/Idh/MocA family oxidoreductase, partial [Woeseiaceae bacterium]|nr:Gfo/Idh/MocA family oxidoreductase [Woeseiaceae bacterium]